MKKQFTKKPMAEELAKFADIPKVQASFILDVLFDTMIKKIKDGHDVILPNIGTLRLIPTKKEMVSNLTGQVIPPHKRLKFKINLKLARLIRVGTREYKIK